MHLDELFLAYRHRLRVGGVDAEASHVPEVQLPCLPVGGYERRSVSPLELQEVVPRDQRAVLVAEAHGIVRQREVRLRQVAILAEARDNHDDEQSRDYEPLVLAHLLIDDWR